MAQRNVAKKTVVYQKRPSSSSKAEKTRRDEVKQKQKPASASGLTKTLTEDFFAKEEEYKMLNAELEAKTAELVREAEQIMREQNKVLSKPISTLSLMDVQDEEDLRITTSPQGSVREKSLSKNRQTSPSQNKDTRSKIQSRKLSAADVVSALEDSTDSFVAKTIRCIEEKMNDTVIEEDPGDDHDFFNEGDNVGSGVSAAQIRVLKAKIRILEEELDQLSGEYYKKDDENAKLLSKIKDLEEDRARTQKTSIILQTQMEKQKALAEESAKKCDGLQLHVSALNKEIENLNRAGKQAAAAHGSVEVRLNRALEEVERSKAQLNRMKQSNKDKMSEEHQSKENLAAENRTLKKQKAELIVGFKKQLKLIDILKRQKMHFEAARLLSFTEEEFMKALDWGSHKH